MPTSYEDNVFINCPFDDVYKPIFDAIIFAVHDAGFIARCSLEVSDTSQNRLEKIIKIISECQYSIHDISRTDLDPVNSLPRFNMPLELGIFLGCKSFGSKKHHNKVCIVLDKEPYRYQKFISDIAGQDIFSHDDNPQRAIDQVRDWLRTESKRTNIPGGGKIYERYILFENDLPDICKELNIRVKELTFVDFTYVMTEWLKGHTI
jgi:hypothetical protein